MPYAAQFAAVLVLSYFLGAIPFGLLVGKLYGVDIRQVGSGKTGATNVLRSVGVKPALIVFAADLAKGAAPVIIARYVLHSNIAEVCAAMIAVSGHCWSVYIRFRGGRGVTTAAGGLLAMCWPVALVGLGVFFAIVARYRMASLGSLLAPLSVIIMLAVLLALGKVPVAYLIYALVAVAFIVFTHRDNIARLLSGTERKLGGAERASGEDEQ